ncbi:hypothetical protein ACFVSN_07220 [Kitasatospora sp. NPDC057904]|uniref:hypothetical protein n=1 Tax=Kitasatospora sp. NPDC057904 TaxID=3346275 RepID=UPI0036DE61CB
MERARREIAAALEAVGDGEVVASLRVLGAALQWVCAELRGIDGGPGGASALEALYELDDALTAGEGLRDAVDVLFDAVLAGAAVRRDVGDLADRLRAAKRAVQAEREALDELEQREHELRRRLAELTELRRQVDDLRRLERIVSALDGLARQQEVITARLLALRGKDTGVEDVLRTSADRLVRLSEEQLAALSPQTRDRLARAQDVDDQLSVEQRRFEESSARLAEVRDRLDSVRTRRVEQLASLRLHAHADAELARALAPESVEADGSDGGARSALVEAEALAASLETRLTRVDEILAGLLERREQEDDGTHAALSWADQ